MCVVMLAIIFVLCSCSGDDDASAPSPDLTGLQADIDEKFETLHEEINTLRADIAAGRQLSAATDGNITIVEGTVPAQVINDQIGGLPPSGEPVVNPIDAPFVDVPVVGAERIIFSVSGEGIYMIGSNGAGKTAVVLPQVLARHPALSPDGERVAYSLGDWRGINLVVRHIESGREFQLSQNGGKFPAWSFDGERIAYSDGMDIFIAVVDPVNPNIVKITHDRNFNQHPTWSPDGERIAFCSMLDSNYNIFAINADGTNRIRVTRNPGDEWHPDWSPDGEQLAFMRFHNNTWDIYLVDIGTLVQIKLTDSQHHYWEPSWSPDGSKIVMHGAAMGTSDIYVINADGTGLTNITNSPELEESPDW